jgi:hypothetical protein
VSIQDVSDFESLEFTRQWSDGSWEGQDYRLDVGLDH